VVIYFSIMQLLKQEETYLPTKLPDLKQDPTKMLINIAP